MTRHILILVENLPVPFDRRVWQESRALVEAGYQVSVICPMGQDEFQEPEIVIDGVRILRFPLRPATGDPKGYLREYGLALWHTWRLTRRVNARSRVDVVQACNPPDLLFLVALSLRRQGTRFVFDHHDLVPELFLSRFPGSGRTLHAVARLLERVTFATAHGVISTNESYRQIALERGGMREADVVVVRSGPDLDDFAPLAPDPSLRRGKQHLLAYLGVMGPQDGVDYALRALAQLRLARQAEDVHCIFMGDGDARHDMMRLSAELGLDDMVEFTGRVPDEFVRRCLSTADVCLSPDPKSPLNDLSTMNKVIEYMAMSRPLVSFDLKETRVSAGEAALYAPADDEAVFAAQIQFLLEDEPLRESMGKLGRARVEDQLNWGRSRDALVGFYQRLIGPAASAFPAPRATSD